MEKIRLRPDYEIPVIRDTYEMIIPNKKGVRVYRASKKYKPKSRSKEVRAINSIPKKLEYAKKNDKLEIYQLFHNNDAFKNCFDTEYITRLSLNPNFITADPTVLFVKDIKHITNQISETRAFLYLGNKDIRCDYVGFTSHRHNGKFYAQDRSISIEDINLDIVRKVFDTCLPVKMIGFRLHPAHDFISTVQIGDKTGVPDFMYGFFRDCYHFDRPSYNNMLKSMDGKIFPYCNSFILPRLEFKNYVTFVSEFLDWADGKYGLDKVRLAVDRVKRSYSPDRGWGYLCEQLPWYYLTFKYVKNFVMAFIDDEHKITYHDRIGYQIEG